MRYYSLVRVAAWTLLVFIVFATLSPAYLRPALTASPSFFVVILERVGAYALLGLLFSIGYPRRYRFVFVVVFGSAIVLEFLQIIIPDRHARLFDTAAKLTGGAVGITAQRLLMRYSASGTLRAWILLVTSASFARDISYSL
jgi:VanZ family protein